MSASKVILVNMGWELGDDKQFDKTRPLYVFAQLQEDGSYIPCDPFDEGITSPKHNDHLIPPTYDRKGAVLRLAQLAKHDARVCMGFEMFDEAGAIMSDLENSVPDDVREAFGVEH